MPPKAPLDPRDDDPPYDDPEDPRLPEPEP